MDSKGKESQFYLQDGKYVCCLCKKALSSKRRILMHLHNIHKCCKKLWCYNIPFRHYRSNFLKFIYTPVKKVKKLYMYDNAAKVPKRTLRRWKMTYSDSQEQTLMDVDVEIESTNGVSRARTDRYSPDQTARLMKLGMNINYSISETCCRSVLDDDLSETSDISEVASRGPSDMNINNSNSESCCPSELDDDLSDISELALCVPSDMNINNSNSESCCPSVLDDDLSETSDISELASYSETESLLTTDNSSDDELPTDATDCLSFKDIVCDENQKPLSEQEAQALTILSCFLRNNLSASACRDIMQKMKTLFPKSESVSSLDFDRILTYVDTSNTNEIAYCTICNQTFPEELDHFQCSTINCDGLRYKGPLSNQLKPGRLPRQSFVFADPEQQLLDLLHSPGSPVVSDITDGEFYQKFLESEHFVPGNKNLTGIFNTDGVNLYSSSHIELWPIFLAINELSPGTRFARENMLLIGLWQGKGKPPFKQFMHIFSEQMNKLYREGINIIIESEMFNVKLAVICCTLDLPAKASVLNMTFFNGTHACITCEEPGECVKQGKGYARCYPYRGEHTFPLRNSETVETSMHEATEKKRVKGFKGVSGLATLQSLHLVEGILPDYMHGILLGITKLLLSKWFSPTESKKEYFIGKHLKNISTKLQNIKPPEYIERLPRDLEKNYSHFKATELQSWLLYYGLPCLIGVLPDIYLEHFANLSESIYILLGDEITQTGLARAEMLLDRFYTSFEKLYGRGSCGINIHNAGAHIVYYVKKFGPLWAWSCFAFEDCNALLLKTVHGTGNVLKQVMRIRQCQGHIRRVGMNKDKSKMWKVSNEAINCDISGGLKNVKVGDLSDEVLDKLDVTELRNIKRADRLVINGKKLYAATYARIKRRTCYVVLYEITK
ncbi:hypothetical protein MAR_024157 [Mya arenaria]|uniref:C2H2-type domain-containing protein n=1 Tax=Mya arenaria TaxID=6604 RepID=A0ABY7DT44_MYAAR|nr:hypothetical protein MAR_024157 [Mya arenaria]